MAGSSKTRPRRAAGRRATLRAVAASLAWLIAGPVASEGQAEPTETTAAGQGLARVGALGRLEPRGGVRHVAGPPHPVVVIEALRVEEGDRVRTGQEIALLAGIGPARAEAARLRAESARAQRELERNRSLSRSQVVAASRLEALETDAEVARASLQRAEEELALYTVRSPIDGQVLEIHVRAGERVGPEGIAKLGQTDAMYAIAEVYETDVARVRVGQRARIRSPALALDLEGVVERIGLEIDKNDVLTTDPVADADTRVVEVEISLLESEAAARLTNLRVEVEIDAEGAAP